MGADDRYKGAKHEYFYDPQGRVARIDTDVHGSRYSRHTLTNAQGQIDVIGDAPCHNLHHQFIESLACTNVIA